MFTVRDVKRTLKWTTTKIWLSEMDKWIVFFFSSGFFFFPLFSSLLFPSLPFLSITFLSFFSFPLRCSKVSPKKKIHCNPLLSQGTRKLSRTDQWIEEPFFFMKKKKIDNGIARLLKKNRVVPNRWNVKWKITDHNQYHRNIINYYTIVWKMICQQSGQPRGNGQNLRHPHPTTTQNGK